MTRACAVLCSVLTITLVVLAQQNQEPQIRTGIFRGRKVTYQVIHGKNIYQGDIVLDHVDEPNPSGVGNGIGIVYASNMWPKVGNVFEIPYTITSGDQKVTNSIATFNTIFSGFMQWVPRTNETDYVDFNLDVNDHSQVCNSSEGRVGGKQEIGGSIDCTDQLHEMGHAVGIWHEQSRSDRNSYVNITYSNIIKILQPNFDQLQDNAQDIGFYDYASTMEYGAYTFSKNGKPTIETIPPGIPLVSASPGYSAGDIDNIRRTYGAAPTAVTVTSNPVGLQVTVDGSVITTPQTFNWALNSTHTLSAPTTVQTLNSTPYIYGRWNDNTAASHTITVTPGNGLTSQPATSPAVTVYSANFSMLVPYTSSVFPVGTGTISATPAAQAFPGGTGIYYVARQPVTITATPNAGQNFYAFINSPFWLPYSLSVNPKNFNAPDDGNGINLQALFTSSPVYTVTSNLSDPAIGVLIDGGFWYAPKNLSAFYDSGWNAGSVHSIGAFDPEIPWATTFKYPFVSWSDSGTLTHDITVPANSTTYTATFGAQYQLADFANQPCAATLNVTPPAPLGDGFYDSGTQLTFSETPLAGWTFTGWQHDLTGTQSPKNLTVNDEIYVTADYNTVSTPISVSSLSPSSATAGGSGFTLTINGAGFTANSVVFVNNTFRAITFVNSGRVTVPVTAADIATAGAIQVFIQNFPSGATCAAFAAKPFFVLAGTGTSATVSPTSLTFAKQAAGTISASQSVTLTNTGSNPLTIGSIAASGNFAQSNNCPGSLAASSSCTINVTFNPSLVGVVTGALTLIDNAGSSPQVVALSGTGVIPLTFKPANLNLGSVAVGHSATKNVTLLNNQSSPLNLAASASANYSITGGSCGATLAGGAQCTISITFQPTVNGVVAGGLSISDSSPLSPQVLALTGTGTGGPAAPLKFSPAKAAFKLVAVGSTGSKVLTVTNSTASALTINSFAGSGNFSAAGSGATPCGGPLAAGAHCTLTVTFAPSILTTIKGGIAIATTAPGSPQVLGASGTTIAAVTLAPVSLTFPAQAVGTTSASQTVTLKNNASTAVTIASLVASGDYAAVPGGATPCGSSVAAGASCTFNVTFTPNVSGTISGAATVNHNAPLGPTVLKLTGTGQ